MDLIPVKKSRIKKKSKSERKSEKKKHKKKQGFAANPRWKPLTSMDDLDEQNLKREKTKSEMIKDGDLDDDIIQLFRDNKLSLNTLVSGARWNEKGSGYRALVGFLNLEETDDESLTELYKTIEFNKRYIRDRIMETSPDKKITAMKRVEAYEMTIYAPEPNPPPVLERTITPTLPPPQQPIPQRLETPPPAPPPPSPPPPSESPTPPPSETPPPPPSEPPPPPPTEPPPPPPPPSKPHPSKPPSPSPLPRFREFSESRKVGKQSISEIKSVNWGREAVIKSCPRCGYVGQTKVSYRIGSCTWTWVCVMFFSIICLAFSWTPFVNDKTKDALHICRKCQYILGKVPRRPCHKTHPDNWDWDKNEVKTPKKYEKLAPSKSQ